MEQERSRSVRLVVLVLLLMMAGNSVLLFLRDRTTSARIRHLQERVDDLARQVQEWRKSLADRVLIHYAPQSTVEGQNQEE